MSMQAAALRTWCCVSKRVLPLPLSWGRWMNCRVCHSAECFSFSQSSRTRKWSQHAAYEAFAFTGYMPMFCRTQVFPAAVRWNIYDKIQKHVSKWHVTWQLIFFVSSCLWLCSGCIAHVFSFMLSYLYALLACSRDGRRQTSEGKFEQAVQERVSFRIRENCLWLGTIYGFLALFFGFFSPSFIFH